jgi:hypothetical protein
MVDSVQKMIEEVSDMLVKELPALSDSIESEIGVNESEQFNSQVAEALGTLNASLQQAQTALKGALGIVTGKGGPSFDSQMAGGDAGADLEADNDMTDVDAQAGADMSLPPPPEPKEPMNNIGREKR